MTEIDNDKLLKEQAGNSRQRIQPPRHAPLARPQ